MNLPSGEISCPERLFRLSDSESVGVCLVCACAGRESPRNASTEKATASFFKRAPPADVQLYQTNGDGGWSHRDRKSISGSRHLTGQAEAYSGRFDEFDAAADNTVKRSREGIRL